MAELDTHCALRHSPSRVPLAAAFPFSLRPVAEKVSRRLSVDQGYYAAPFEVNVAGEAVLVPSRVHFTSPAQQTTQFAPVECHVASCLASRSTDGFERQRALAQILPLNEPWSVPFVVSLIGEYVIEILNDILEGFDLLDGRMYANFLQQNGTFHDLLTSRVVSYWECYHRGRFPDSRDYVGFRLLGRFDRLVSRVEPAPSIVAEAARFLLGDKQHWRRWSREPTALDDALARPDVADRLAEAIRTASSGPMGTLLRHALRRPGMDHHLPGLAATARQPAVRAVALQTLIEGSARWPVDFERRWVGEDRTNHRHDTAFGEREIARQGSLEALMARGARDPSVAVRRVAADGLIRHRSSLSNLDEVVWSLAGDRSASVRERAEFVLRERESMRRYRE